MDLNFEQIEKALLEYKAKSEYKQAAIIMVRNIFKEAEKEQLKLYGVSQRSELLLAFVDYYCTLEGVNYLPEEPKKMVEDFIANNCG